MEDAKSPNPYPIFSESLAIVYCVNKKFFTHNASRTNTAEE